MSSEALVPGDVVEVPNESFLPCDMILLNGHGIVNESILTGESMPILKNSLKSDSEVFVSEGN